MYHHFNAYYLIPLGLVAVGAMYVTMPSLLVIIALPATALASSRLGAAGAGNSFALSDFILFLSTLVALTLVSRPVLRRLRPLFILVAVYQFGMLLSVLHNPNRYDIVEWFHELAMVGGALVVGAVLIQRGKAKISINVFMVLCLIGAAWAIVGTGLHGWHPSSDLPLGVQKNFIGDVLVVAVLLAQLNPSWAGLNQAWIRPTKYLCVAGVLASQSRQSMVALIVTLVVVELRRRRVERRAQVLLVAMVPLAIVAYVTISNQLQHIGNNNSITVRQAKLTQTMAIWRTSPIFGVGERFWNTKQFPGAIQPPNAEAEMLAAAGVIGLACFAIFVLGSLWLLWRLPPAGMVGFAVLLAHVIAGQFDIFWATGTGYLPWIIVGMAVTATMVDRAGPAPPEEEAAEEEALRVHRVPLSSRITATPGLGLAGR